MVLKQPGMLIQLQGGVKQISGGGGILTAKKKANAVTIVR